MKGFMNEGQERHCEIRDATADHPQSTRGPLVVELSVDLNASEIASYREAISQANENWQRSAIMFFASLRERRSRYAARQIAKGYNAAV
jgi:hypothetical protein